MGGRATGREPERPVTHHHPRLTTIIIINNDDAPPLISYARLGHSAREEKQKNKKRERGDDASGPGYRRRNPKGLRSRGSPTPVTTQRPMGVAGHLSDRSAGELWQRAKLDIADPRWGPPPSSGPRTPKPSLRAEPTGPRPTGYRLPPEHPACCAGFERQCFVASLLAATAKAAVSHRADVDRDCLRGANPNVKRGLPSAPGSP